MCVARAYRFSEMVQRSLLRSRRFTECKYSFGSLLITISGVNIKLTHLYGW